KGRVYFGVAPGTKRAGMIAQEGTHSGMKQQNSGGTAFEPDVHLDRLLLVSEIETPWYRSVFNNIRELINPPKLPPLEVTSKPVAVNDIWDKDENKGK